MDVTKTETNEPPLPNDLVIESTTDDEAGIRAAFGLGDADLDAAIDGAVTTASEATDGEEPPVAEPPPAGDRVDTSAATDAARQAAAAGPKKTPAQIRKDAIQAEINASTRARHDAQRELEATRRELETARAERAALAAPPAAAVKPVVDAGDAPQAMPEIDAFDDLNEYHTAVKTWAADDAARSARVAVKARNAEIATERQAAEATAAQRAKQLAAESYTKQVDTFKVDHPDFDDLLAANDLSVTPVMEAAILTSTRGAEIAYHLLQHPEDAAALVADTTSIGPEGLSLVRRTLEARLAAAQTPTGTARGKRTTETPAPIRPVSLGSPATTKPLDELPIEDYMRIRNQEENVKLGRA
jgi:hypothetical protein